MTQPGFDLPAAAHPQSLVRHEGVNYWLEGEGPGRILVIASPDPQAFAGFQGETHGSVLRAPANAANAHALRARLPWLAPRTFGLETSAGTGDRLGLCTPGHVRAMFAAGSGIHPVFAQQSIREMGRTHREPQEVLDDATWGAFQEGWTAGVGADADHLKTTEDIDRCARAGFVYFTIDPGDSVDPEAETADQASIMAKLAALDWQVLDSDPESFARRYVGHTIELSDQRIVLDQESVLRAMAKYGPALVQALGMVAHLEGLGIDHETEIAVDETRYPTRPAEHVVIASELRRLGVDFVSFAPRFVGSFEKGVEFIGSLDALRRDFQLHAEIARALGPYKLSLHSGSDKYSSYPLLAEATGGMLHLKTAGTSWVEALRIIARHDGELMRAVLGLAVDSFQQNRHSYQLSTDLSKVPVHPGDDQLDALITARDSRQVLHVSFGAVLDAFGPQLRAIWQANAEELDQVIQRHFIRHLAPFSH